MSKNAIIVLVILGVLLVGGLLLAGGKLAPQENAMTQASPTPMPTEMPTPTPTPKVVQIPLGALNKSGETGTATLTEMGDKTQVVLMVDTIPAGASQPAHIHLGACPVPKDIAYELSPVTPDTATPGSKKGTSETLVDISINQLIAQLPLAINIHKSDKDIKTYVSCGDIKDTTAGMSDINMTPSPAPTTGGATVTGTADQTFNLTGKNFSFSQSEIRVKKGAHVKIDLTISGGMHDWVVDQFNARTQRGSDGQTVSVDFIADKAGTFEYYCSVGNHRAMGMKGNLIVQ